MVYKTKYPHLIVRLFTVFLLCVAVVTGLLKRWDAFGLSLGVLMIIVVFECYILLRVKMDERFDKLEKLIKPIDDKNEHKQD